jgi:hypothetical protein
LMPSWRKQTSSELRRRGSRNIGPLRTFHQLLTSDLLDTFCGIIGV